MLSTARYLRFDTVDARSASSDERPVLQESGEVLHIGHLTFADLRCGLPVQDWGVRGGRYSDALRISGLYTATGTGLRWHHHEIGLVPRSTAVRTPANGAVDGAVLRTLLVEVAPAVLPIGHDAVRRIVTCEPAVRGPVFRVLVLPAMSALVGRLAELARIDIAGLTTVWLAMITMLLRSLDRPAGDDDDGSGDSVRGAAPHRRSHGPALLDEVQADAALRLELHRVIDANLSDPALTPGEVAAHLHLSRRSLYRLLGTGTGVADIIRRQRLERAHQLLVDPDRIRMPIAAVAAAVGLPNAAHFSRAFRSAYGVAPREVRRSAARIPG